MSIRLLDDLGDLADVVVGGEDAGDVIEQERYGMPEIYAFSTDFPHPEGGTDPIGRMAADIEPLGHDVVEAFFVGNAELLLPA